MKPLLHHLALAAVMMALLAGCATRQQMEASTARMQQLEKSLAAVTSSSSSRTELDRVQAEWKQRLDEQDQRLATFEAQWQDFSRQYSPAVRAELEQNLKAAQKQQLELKELLRQATLVLSDVRQTQQESTRLLRGIESNHKDSAVLNVVNRFEALDVKTQAALSESRALVDQAQRAAVSAEGRAGQSSQQVLFAQRTVEDMRHEAQRQAAEQSRTWTALQQEIRDVERMLAEARNYHSQAMGDRKLIQQLRNEQVLARQRIEYLEMNLRQLLQAMPPRP